MLYSSPYTKTSSKSSSSNNEPDILPVVIISTCFSNASSNANFTSTILNPPTTSSVLTIISISLSSIAR